jgi:hypothetical protein
MKTIKYEDVSRNIPSDEINIIDPTSLSSWELELIATYLILRVFRSSIESAERDVVYHQFQEDNLRKEFLGNGGSPTPEFKYPTIHFPFPLLPDYLRAGFEINIKQLESTRKITFPNLSTEDLKLKILWEKTLESKDGKNGVLTFKFKLALCFISIRKLYKSSSAIEADSRLDSFLREMFKNNSIIGDYIDIFDYKDLEDFYRVIRKKKNPTKKFSFTSAKFIKDLVKLIKN